MTQFRVTNDALPRQWWVLYFCRFHFQLSSSLYSGYSHTPLAYRALDVQLFVRFPSDFYIRAFLIWPVIAMSPLILDVSFWTRYRLPKSKTLCECHVLSLTSPSWNAFWNSVVFSSIERRFLGLEWWLPQTTILTQPAILMRRTILLQLATLRHRLTILALRTMAPANGNGSFKQEFLFEQRFFCN